MCRKKLSILPHTEILAAHKPKRSATAESIAVLTANLKKNLMYFVIIKEVIIDFKFRKFCNLLIFKTSPYPLQRGNEIVYDSQEVRERTFSRLIDNFCLFQRILHTQLWALAGFPLSEGIVREYMERSMWGEVYFVTYWLLTNYKYNYNLKMTCET